MTDPTRNKDKQGKNCRMVSTYYAKLRLLSFEPGSKLLILLGMAIPPLIGNPFHGSLLKKNFMKLGLKHLVERDQGTRQEFASGR